MKKSALRPGVLLAHSFFLRHDEKQWQKMKPYSPLATLIAAAALRERGHDVSLFDAMLADGIDDYLSALDESDCGIVAIIEDNFNFITKMCTAQMREDAFAMVRAAKQRGCRIVVSGSYAVDYPQEHLRAGADAVITGEVEPALCELVALWQASPAGSPASIAGLALPSAGSDGSRLEVLRTAARPYHSNLNSLPHPAWDLVDAEEYRSAWEGRHGRLSWNAVTSRGCPYGCNWCAKPLWGRRYAQRDAVLAADELRALRERIAPDHVWFADDIFGLTPAWIEAFADHVVARDAFTPFMMQSRANLMTERSVAALSRAGAEEVWLGVESGSQRVLDAMDKNTNLEQIRTATRTLKKYGIRCGWFVMLGYPGETWTDILSTRDLIRDEAPDDIGVSVAYPLPGTGFYDRVRAQLGARRNWQETDDLAMLFQGAYGTEFYRSVRAALHAEVRGVDESTRHRADAWLDLASSEPSARMGGAVMGTA